jgi:DNA topoisomerase IB
MRNVMFLIVVAVVAVGSASYAHHSYGATYDVKKEVKLEGKLLQFVYRNPHAYVHMQAKDASGVEQRWAVEWAGTAQLSNSGVNKESLKVGDEIVVTARPSRVPGEFRVLMVNLRRPLDGFSWGSRGGEVVD